MFFCSWCYFPPTCSIYLLNFQEVTTQYHNPWMQTCESFELTVGFLNLKLLLALWRYKVEIEHRYPKIAMLHTGGFSYFRPINV